MEINIDKKYTEEKFPQPEQQAKRYTTFQRII